MAKQDQKALEDSAPIAPTTTVTAPKVSLTEFCLNQSAKENRPELIGGFEFIEKRAKRFKDTQEAYAERFEAYKVTPVK